MYAFRGEAERSIERLERAYALRDGGLFLVKVDPLLKSLAPEPRYRELLERMDLAD